MHLKRSKPVFQNFKNYSNMTLVRDWGVYIGDWYYTFIGLVKLEMLQANAVCHSTQVANIHAWLRQGWRKCPLAGRDQKMCVCITLEKLITTSKPDLASYKNDCTVGRPRAAIIKWNIVVGCWTTTAFWIMSTSLHYLQVTVLLWFNQLVLSEFFLLIAKNLEQVYWNSMFDYRIQC